MPTPVPAGRAPVLRGVYPPVILTLVCGMDRVQQALDEGDAVWLGTSYEQLWEKRRMVGASSVAEAAVSAPSGAVGGTASTHWSQASSSSSSLLHHPMAAAPEFDYQHKLSNLKIHLYMSAREDTTRAPKISDCFWCSCPFRSDVCHVLRYGNGGKIFGKGVYCTPECATAGLFHQTPECDDTERYESYQLMNRCYRLVPRRKLGDSDAGTETKETPEPVQILPAPAPHYFLDKFLGNMTPEEFRAMNRRNLHMLYTIDRPLTHDLPEMHEETDPQCRAMGLYAPGKGKYRVRRQSEQVKTETTADILRRRFRLEGAQLD